MRRALAALRRALVLNFREKSLPWALMPFSICSAETSCSVTSMPDATHQPAMSAPMVPAPMTWALSGFHLMSLGAWLLRSSESLKTRRRLRDCSETRSGAK